MADTDRYLDTIAEPFSARGWISFEWDGSGTSTVHRFSSPGRGAGLALLAG
jgi:hypothetical protein